MKKDLLNSILFSYSTLKLSVLLAFLFSSVLLSAQTQILINKSWKTLTGNPVSGIDWSSSISDASDNIITTGNSVDDNFNVNLFLSKQSRNGQLLWQQEFNAGLNSKNYGIKAITDSNDNIYVIGATFNPTNINHDYLVLKYNANGTLLWSHIENGPDNGEDVPSDLTIDTSGNVIITGASYGDTTDYDMLTLSLTTSGVVNWKKRYDSSSYPDAAVTIHTDANGNIQVTGGSATSSTNWNYTNLKYNNTNGNLISQFQTAAASNGFKMPTAVTLNSNNDIIITGYSEVDSQNNCYTVVLDEDLNILWEKWYDGEGLDDRAMDVVIDDNDNVYICGYTEKASGGTDFLLIKYDDSGNLLWQQKRTANDRKKSAQAQFLTFDPIYDHIIVTGEEFGENNNSYLKTIRYDSDGKLLWEDIHDESSQAPEKSTGLLFYNDASFLISGILKGSGGNQQYQAVMYEPFIYEQTYDSLNNVATNIHKEIIIRFNPRVIDTSFADNTGLIYGDVDQIITDTNLINTMDAKLNTTGRIRDWKMIKLFPFLTTGQRTLISRLGEEVFFESIWSTYTLILENSMSETEAVDSLSTIDYSGIVHAELDVVGQVQTPPPPDEHYDLQAALHEVTGFEDAHINIEPAWAVVDGSPSIKVGFIDTGLAFDHPEFGTTFNGLGGSVVEAGYNFLQSSDPIPFDDNDTENDLDWPHGTRMAGIVGALRNNGIGISGVAGGDADSNTDGGVQLTILQAATPQALSSGDIITALVFAATQGGSSGPLVDIINMSLGWSPESETQSLTSALNTTFRAGVINVASRGNSQPTSTTEELHPATATVDKKIINVGGSGTDGELKESVTNSSGTPPDVTGEQWMSMYDKEMDIIAPATSNLILTTNNLQNIGDVPLGYVIGCDTPLDDFDGVPDYNCFNGTSSAAAFTSGVSALLLEQHETHGIDLAIEDVERLLEYGATDIGSNGYDTKNAWGRLNAGGSMDFISGTKKVVHFQVTPSIDVDYCTFCAIELSRPYEIVPGEFITTFMGSPIAVKVRKHTYQVNIDFFNEYNGTELIDPGISVGKEPAWPLNSRSNIWGRAFQDLGTTNSEVIDPEEDVYWESGPAINNDVLTGTLVGFSYEVISGPYTGEILPKDDNNYRMWFSVLVNDPNDSFNGDVTITSIHDQENKNGRVLLFPNPTQNQLNIQLDSPTPTSISSIEIFDMNGRLIQYLPGSILAQSAHHYELNTSTLPPGVYVVKLSDGIHFYQSRFVKL